MIQRLFFSTFIERRFTDIVNGKDVNLYRCKNGSYFLAHSKLESIFFHVEFKP